MWGPTEKFPEISEFPQTTAHQDADALYAFKSRGFGGEIGLNRLLFPLFLTRSCRLQSFPDNLLLADFKDRHGIVSVVPVAERVR